MAGKKAYLDHLAKVPLFSSMSTRDLQRISRATDEVTMPAGMTIIDQGQAGREAFVIVSGEATVKRNGKKVATLGPGSIVGELSLLDRGPRTATVTCDTQCTLLVIESRAFAAVIDDVPALAHKLLASLASRIRELDRRSFG
jgi:CRP/FNR family transcriptional regulator, cyclic AMP receptor protein